MIDLYQLRTFLAAAREQNFARAARDLHVSPPAVSQSIALLERSTGRKLFLREGRRVLLTAEGAALKLRAEKIFDEVAAAERDLAGALPEPGELRLVVREMITNHLLPPVLADLEKSHPGTRVGLHALDPKAMTDALLKDKADFGYWYATILEDGLSSVLLGRIRSRVYAAPSLLRRLGRPRTPAQTLRLPFVAPRPFEEDPSVPSADGFPDARLRRDIRYRAELFETHRVFALSGMCAAVLPDGAVEEERRRGRLVALPGPALGREVYFFKRKGRVLPAAADEINAGLRRELARWG
ncbi:MAG: LysR family transcriptional regulator [Elusimicrobiota bacterium]